MEQPELLVVGAGISGLACARSLRDAGRQPVVLERARGVGGRCATRRVDDQAVDHGVVFVHGDDPDLRSAVEGVDALRLDGWPQRVWGSGLPCQPAAFNPGQWRAAYAEGVSTLPKSLARGLDVRLLENVDRLTVTGGQWEIQTRAGHGFRSRELVLALALEQTRQLLGPLAATEPAVRGVERLLATFATVPCLTLIAGYPPSTVEPPWDMAYPEDSSILQLISHDSAKRPEPTWRVLVYQAHASWSRARLSSEADAWAAEILAEAGRLLGPWAVEPSWTQTHRWRYARLDAGSELVCPILIKLAGGARLCLTGELFSAGGGVQAAFRAGRAAARRLIDGDEHDG